MMKTILVPTDFSKAAENAAVYALQLAKKMWAGVKLLNAFKVPAEAPGSAQAAWPLNDFTSVKKEAVLELNLLANKLKHNYYFSSDTYIPQLDCECEPGPATLTITGIAERERTPLVVMGMSGGGLSKLFLGSTAHDMIDKANCPLLLVPKYAEYKDVKKIAFATDLRESDVEMVHSLASLARYYNAEILLFHVTDGSNEGKYHEEVKEFLTDITCKISYAKVYYRHVKSIDVEHGLEWLAEHGQIDMLAVVHRKHNFFERLFLKSHTQEIADHTHIPLLIFPEAYTHVTFF